MPVGGVVAWIFGLAVRIMASFEASRLALPCLQQPAQPFASPLAPHARTGITSAQSALLFIFLTNACRVSSLYPSRKAFLDFCFVKPSLQNM